MSFIKIIAFISALIFNNNALAEGHQESKPHALIAMWTSWIQDIKPKADESAWQELRKIDTRFQIQTQPAQLNLRKGERTVFTISPLGMSFSSKF